MKSFTDLEQSKKLAEILPLESADMYYYKDNVHTTSVYHPNIIIPSFGVRNMPNYGEGDVPCWSLAELLEIIPQEIFDGEYVINITEGLDDRWVITYDNYDNRNHSYYGLSTGADNPVDACYEMILKLYELKML